MKKVLITGGTGLIGKALTQELTARGYGVIILSRSQPPATARRNAAVEYARWNINEGTIDKDALQAADYIVHLAGANVGEGRWTATRKKEIVDSRTRSARLLVKALQETPNKVQAVISSSAIGWYGADRPGGRPFEEGAPADGSFLGTTCRQWEESIDPVAGLGIRLVKLRTGIVLSNRGGAYAEFKKPLHMGVASILGTGDQVVSWIHISDIVGLYLFALENEQVQGVYNAVAPEPVTNRQLVLAMARARNRFYLPVKAPGIALKVLLGEMSVEVLKSATVSSKKAERAGYQFRFPNIGVAVKNLSINEGN
ncbi:TIGR01777 family oxidoreductase [Paraflavisolibacter sp. H34]|uniref:TIGR01777 family oxidoreductase n=1 Tax=Huijunlia imazamoxiresistens TaxID=3127457 RepID=UPI003016C555